jgi:transcription antitermination factor NusA-like protein
MDALTYKLEQFEGPLDLLLTLIQKNKVSITDIPISLICDQYLEYIREAEALDMDIASEFIVMASELMLIKSKMLLPKEEEPVEDEGDPRDELVRRLLESEVPEIFDGLVEIKSVSREAGSRSKIAVYSADENVDPVGACIGQRGARVNRIVDQLGGEKLDIVRYSENPAEYVAAALAPANVISVDADEEASSCRVIVNDDQLSLAIGKDGQNARLAAKLTGYKIDIKPMSSLDQ